MTTEAEVYNALKYHVVVDSYGTRRYYNSADQLHRLDGPAVERSDGTKEWCQNGLHHREDGPAVERADGSKFWHQNGKLHREDGPAAVWSDGDLHWFQQGLLHREDGPAVVRFNATVREWYLRGVQYTEKQYNQQCKHLGLAGQTRNQYG